MASAPPDNECFYAHANKLLTGQNIRSKDEMPNLSQSKCLSFNNLLCLNKEAFCYQVC